MLFHSAVTSIRDDIEANLRLVPVWAESQIDLRLLEGGITNRNYVATIDGSKFVLRIPGERTDLLGIDRRSEAEVLLRAGTLGIGPEVVVELPGVGTQILKFVEGRHLVGDEFVERLPEVVDTIASLHRSGDSSATFAIHRVVERHASDAEVLGVALPYEYSRLHRESLRIEGVFSLAPNPLVLCHNDLLPGNLLFDDERVWLLDYEYAGMNTAYFDLANLSINFGLSAQAEEQLLQLYFGEVTSLERARLSLMKVMSEFREGMWGVVQQGISSLETNFVEYTRNRLDSATRLIDSNEYESWIVAASSNPRA